MNNKTILVLVLIVLYSLSMTAGYLKLYRGENEKNTIPNDAQKILVRKILPREDQIRIIIHEELFNYPTERRFYPEFEGVLDSTKK